MLNTDLPRFSSRFFFASFHALITRIALRGDRLTAHQLLLGGVFEVAKTSLQSTFQ
ncbi:MAG TPA: hypothetical protein VNX00_03045 [Herbaspirillum sp.]|nr:hypothetical protein [Herbaspirillum sp.]